MKKEDNRSIEFMLKKDIYKKEFDCYSQFLENFTKLYMARFNDNARIQYIKDKAHIIDMLKKRYQQEYDRREKTNGESKEPLFLEYLLDGIETIMDNNFTQEKVASFTPKTGKCIKLAAVNNFKTKNDLNEVLKELLNKVDYHYENYDYQRLDSFINALRSLSEEEYANVNNSFLKKTNNRFLLAFPITANYLASNPQYANKFISEYRAILRFINKHVEAFVNEHTIDSGRIFEKDSEAIISEAKNEYFIKYQVRLQKLDIIFYEELKYAFDDFYRETFESVNNEYAALCQQSIANYSVAHLDALMSMFKKRNIQSRTAHRKSRMV